MTLEEMLTLDYDEHKFNKIKPECVMGYCHSRMNSLRRRWYITENQSLIKKIVDGLWIFDGDGFPVHVMKWQEFYIAGLTEPNKVRVDDRDEYMENLGWELIPPKYYSREVEGT